MPRDNVNVSYCFYNDIGKLVCGHHPLNGEKCTEHASDSYGTTNLHLRRGIQGVVQDFKRVTVWYYPLIGTLNL